MISQRNSNIELLRILCMLMVIILHFNNHCANPGLLGLPDVLSTQLAGGFMIECLCIVAVNCFVLISGYFGINLKVRSVLKLYLQCFYIGLLSYLLYVCLTPAALSIRPLLGRLLAFTHNHWWFVISYLCLMFVSPLLNAAADTLSKKKFLLSIILYGVIVVYLGWYKNLENTNAGYSVVSFVFLYLIGRYIGKHISLESIKNKRWCFGIGYVVGSLVLWGLLILQYYKGLTIRYVFQYDHPLVIINSCLLLLFFLSLSCQSKVINWIASSVFAAYLLQESIYFGHQWFYPRVFDLFLTNNHWIVDLLVISIVFVLISVLIDKLILARIKFLSLRCLSFISNKLIHYVHSLINNKI